MGKLSWKVKFGLVLVALSAVMLYLHSLAFHHTDLHEFGPFLLTHEIAMMPLEVLVVTLVIHSLLERREHAEKMQKLNMVIGAFYSEVGDELLRRASALDEATDMRVHFLVDKTWDARRYAAAKAAVSSHKFKTHADQADLASLKEFIVGKRQFLLGLLQNPTLLEHEGFTHVLCGPCSTSPRSSITARTSARFPRATSSTSTAISGVRTRPRPWRGSITLRTCRRSTRTCSRSWCARTRWTRQHP